MRTRRGIVWDGRLQHWLTVRKQIPGGHPICGIAYGEAAKVSMTVPDRFAYPANADVCEHEVTAYLDRLGLVSI